MIWTLYKSELSAGNNGAKWSKWRQWLGQTPLARDGSRAETDTRREREGTFWMKTNVKTIKAIFPLINSPHWLLGLLSLRSHPVSKWMRTRCPSVIGFGLGGQEKTKIDAQCHKWKRIKRNYQWIKVWKYWMNRVLGDNWQIVFTNDKISWSKVAFSIQFAVYFSFEIWQKMTNRIWNTIFVLYKYWYFSGLEMCLFWLVFGFLGFFHIQM